MKYFIEFVIVYAAFLVCSRWCRAFCSMIESAKISVATMMSKEIIKVPHSAQNIPTSLPNTVTG